MAAQLRRLCVIAVLLFTPFLAAPAGAQQAALGTLTPEDTLFVTDFAAAAVSRDFSPFLKDLRVQWLILADGENLNASAAAQKDLLLIGALSSPVFGLPLDDLLSPDDIARIQRQGWAVLEKPHPWDPGRVMLLAAGVSQLDARSAAESAAAAILDASPSRAGWFQEAQAAGQEQLRAAIARAQHPPSENQLSIDQLTAQPDARPRSVTAEEAAEDVNHLFQLLEDGWCGYAAFAAQGDFSQAKEILLRQLAERNRWSPAALADLLRENLPFIHDCHLRVGDIQYCRHLDWWYDDTLEFWPAADGYHFDLDGVDQLLLEVNDEDPDPFLFPSLNAAGQPIYRLGMLAYEKPPPLRLAAVDGAAPVDIEIPLKTTAYDPWNRFGDQRMGGIPVVTARSFADYYANDMSNFVESAERYRGEPYLILDIRGNGGGSTRWPKAWIKAFTGATPSLKQVLTELISQTSMMGRANLFAESASDEGDSAAAEQRSYLARANQLAGGSQIPHWSGPIFPNTDFIPNDTTLIILVDRAVASSGEGLLSYLHAQVENVLFAGENSMGALIFGQVSMHQLPNSRLKAYVPIKLNMPLDLVWREERGFSPDLWLPPDQALNFTAAAVRAGTISTRLPIPREYFAVPFKEPNLFQRSPELTPLLVIIALFLLVAVRAGRQHRILAVGGLWLAMLGLFYILRFNQPVGYAAILLGVPTVILSAYWRRTPRAEESGAAGSTSPPMTAGGKSEPKNEP